MWDRQQTLASQPFRVLLVHASSIADKEDASFLEKELKHFGCLVDLYAWERDNPLPTEKGSHLARGASLILFVISDYFLKELDKRPEKRNDLYRLATRSLWRRNKGKAVIVSSCSEQEDLVKKLSCHVCSKRDQDAVRRFIDWIGLPLQPRVQAKPIHMVSPSNSQQPATIVARNSQASAPMDVLQPSTSTAQLDQVIWAVPREHQVPDFFMPIAVTQHDGARLPERDVLLHLHDRFKKADRSKIYQVLHGMPGIGKTTLAIKYARTYGRPPQMRNHNNPYRIVLWLNAREGLDKGYSALSKLEGMSQHITDGQANLSQENPLMKWLQEEEKMLLKDEERWLLVLDGYEEGDFELIDKWFSWSSNKGDVLITMAWRPERPEDASYALEVQKLGDAEGADLLAAVAGKGRDVERENAIAIVSELSGLPLAITYAGFSIRGIDIGRFGSYENFLQLYRQKSSNAFGPQQDSVTETFKFLLDEVKGKSDYTYRLLMNCAMLGQRQIPATLIKKLLAEIIPLSDVNEVDREFDAVLRTLRRFSLLENGEQARSQDAPQNDVEQLITIRSIIIRQINEMDSLSPDKSGDERETYARDIVKAVSEALPTGKWDRWSTWPFYLLHVRACIRYIKEFNITDTIDAVRLLYTAGCFIREYPLRKSREQEPGDEMKAKDLLLQALKIRRKLPQEGDNYPDLPTCRNALEELYQERFLYRMPVDYKSLLKMRSHIKFRYNKILTDIQSRTQRTLGRGTDQNATNVPWFQERKNVDEITVLNNLGRLHDDFDEYAEAVKRFQDALKKLGGSGSRRGRDKTLMIEKNLTRALLLNNLAVTSMKAGNFNDVKKALDEAEEAISKAKEEIESLTDSSLEKYRGECIKRCDDCEIQWNVNRAILFIQEEIPGDESTKEAFANAIEAANEAIQSAEKLGGSEKFVGPSEIDYLRLLKRINNLVELHRLRAQKMKKKNMSREENEKALEWYRQAIEIASFWISEEKKLYDAEISHPHPLLLTILESFDAFKKQSRSSNRDRDVIDYCERQASEIRQMFPWFNKGGN